MLKVKIDDVILVGRGQHAQAWSRRLLKLSSGPLSCSLFLVVFASAFTRYHFLTNFKTFIQLYLKKYFRNELSIVKVFTQTPLHK